jgi:hypothetical protein
MDSLFTSERILLSSENCRKLVAGGILVDHESGRIKRIFTSQQEINSWLFIEHGGEVNFPKRLKFDRQDWSLRISKQKKTVNYRF